MRLEINPAGFINVPVGDEYAVLVRASAINRIDVNARMGTIVVHIDDGESAELSGKAAEALCRVFDPNVKFAK